MTGAKRRWGGSGFQSAQTALQFGQLGTVDERGRVVLLARRNERERCDAPKTKGVAQGFDLHADVVAREGDRESRERLCRYVLRPALVLERLTETADGRLAYERKYKSEGATHVVLTPVELRARVSALLFPPRHPILRYHGAFAAKHKLRPRIVPEAPPAQTAALSSKKRQARHVRPEDSPVAARGAAAPADAPPPPAPNDGPRTALAAVNKPLDWATLLKRVYSVDALACPCGGRLRFRRPRH